MLELLLFNLDLIRYFLLRFSKLVLYSLRNYFLIDQSIPCFRQLLLQAFQVHLLKNTFRYKIHVVQTAFFPGCNRIHHRVIYRGPLLLVFLPPIKSVVLCAHDCVPVHTCLNPLCGAIPLPLKPLSLRDKLIRQLGPSIHDPQGVFRR